MEEATLALEAVFDFTHFLFGRPPIHEFLQRFLGWWVQLHVVLLRKLFLPDIVNVLVRTGSLI